MKKQRIGQRAGQWELPEYDANANEHVDIANDGDDFLIVVVGSCSTASHPGDWQARLALAFRVASIRASGLCAFPLYHAIPERRHVLTMSVFQQKLMKRLESSRKLHAELWDTGRRPQAHVGQPPMAFATYSEGDYAVNDDPCLTGAVWHWGAHHVARIAGHQDTACLIRPRSRSACIVCAQTCSQPGCSVLVEQSLMTYTSFQPHFQAQSCARQAANAAPAQQHAQV